MTLKLYGLSKCSTCQKAVDWLDAHKLAHSFSDVKDTPLTNEQLGDQPVVLVAVTTVAYHHHLFHNVADIRPKHGVQTNHRPRMLFQHGAQRL